jgi:hypothetical protein
MQAFSFYRFGLSTRLQLVFHYNSDGLVKEEGTLPEEYCFYVSH